MFTGKTKLMKPFFSRPRTGFGINQTDVKLHLQTEASKGRDSFALKNTNSCLDRTTLNIVTILMLPKLHDFRAKPRLNPDRNLFFEKFPILQNDGLTTIFNRRKILFNYSYPYLPMIK